MFGIILCIAFAILQETDYLSFRLSRWLLDPLFKFEQVIVVWVVLNLSGFDVLLLFILVVTVNCLKFILFRF